MTIPFEKYQATGNDFVLIDNRDGSFPKTDQALVARLCHRKFGIGADGLILIEESTLANFTLVYFNADGALGSFCGNGSRAATRFAASLGLIIDEGKLESFDGLHQASIRQNVIKMSMASVQNGSKILNGTFIDTGSPHYVELRNNLDSLNVFTEGKLLREHEQFKPGGANINFVEIEAPEKIAVRTFERGVEDETLSCGTGVTAAALVTAEGSGSHQVEVNTLGGDLEIIFDKTAAGFENVFLIGPAEKVFSGEIQL